MTIKNQFFKLHSSSVSYEPMKRLLPNVRNRGGFSDVDMLHIYKGQRLCIELKHICAFTKEHGGLSQSIREFFEIGQSKGEYGLVMWGRYFDHNLDTDDYYSTFQPLKAMIYSPDYPEPRLIEEFTSDTLAKFFDFWYKWARDTHNSQGEEE